MPRDVEARLELKSAAGLVSALELPGPITLITGGAAYTNFIQLYGPQSSWFLNGFGQMQFFDTNGVRTQTAFIRQLDGDNDGVPDALDDCPDTGPGILVDPNGCSLDQLSPCAGPWRSHGEFVKVFRAAVANFLRDGLISPRQARDLNAEAAKSDCRKQK